MNGDEKRGRFPDRIEERLLALEELERGKLRATHDTRRARLLDALGNGATAEEVVEALEASLSKGPRGIVSGPPPALSRQQRRAVKARIAREKRKKGKSQDPTPKNEGLEGLAADVHAFDDAAFVE